MGCNLYFRFFTYGPQAPTAFANGPTCILVQSDWIENTLLHFREANLDRFEATAEAQAAWTKQTNDIWTMSLFPLAKSWYQGANIPGKKVEALNWIGGIPGYIEAVKKEAESGYKGFLISG